MFEMFSREYLHRVDEDRRRRLIRLRAPVRPEDGYLPGQRPGEVVRVVFGPCASPEDLIA